MSNRWRLKVSRVDRGQVPGFFYPYQYVGRNPVAVVRTVWRLARTPGTSAINVQWERLS